MKQSVEVELAGQRLVIRTDEGPAYVQELAEYVDAQLKQLAGNAGRSTLNVQRLALLVAIALADELFREKDLHRRFREQITAKLQALDAALGEHTRRIEAIEPPPSKEGAKEGAAPADAAPADTGAPAAPRE